VFGVIFLILEVKPESTALNDLKHRKCLGQPFNYMQINRECFALSYCFSVWTTYNHCRIIWLNDAEHNALAAATVVDPTNKFPLPSNHYDWNGRNVCASKFYERKDNIPMVMSCLVWKLCNAQLLAKTMLMRSVVPTVTSIVAIATEEDSSKQSSDAYQQSYTSATKDNSLKQSSNADQQSVAATIMDNSMKGSNTADHHSRFSTDELKKGKLRTVNREGYYFMMNQKAVDNLTFVMPASTSSKFHLLLQHNGRDGKAWVAANISGHLAVVKFRHGQKKFKFSMNVEEHHVDETAETFTAMKINDSSIGDVESGSSSNSNSTLVNAELQAWIAMYGDLGGCAPFIATLAGREALVVPFAFCFNVNGRLSSSLSSYLPCDDSFGSEMNHWPDIQSQLLALSADAVKLLFTAVVRVADAGYRHNDIKWEHLALLPVFAFKSSTPRLEPILVDLADVEKDPNGLKAMAAYILDNMLHIESDKQEFKKLLLQK